MDETVPLADVIEAMARKDEDVDKSPSGEMISRRLGRINGAPVSRSPFFNEIFSFSLSLSLSLSLFLRLNGSMLLLHFSCLIKTDGRLRDQLIVSNEVLQPFQVRPCAWPVK